jgi:tetratricopeptide (TPR) repeat protein
MLEDSVSNFEEGKTLFKNQHYDDAIFKFKEALHLDPDLSDAHHYLGRSFMEKRLRDAAVKEFCEAIRKNPRDGNSRYWLAIILMENGQVSDAKTLLYEAIRLEPGSLHYFTDRILLEMQKRCTFPETEEFLKNGIALLEESMASGSGRDDTTRSCAYLHGNLGQVYFTKGLLNGAMLQYREAIRICPDLASFHAKLADIYFITNLGEEAVSEYRAALAQGTDDAEVHKKLGDALVKNRQFIDAFNEYREAVRLEPHNEYYRNVYSQFRTLFIDEVDVKPAAAVSRKTALPPHPVVSANVDLFRTLIEGGENELVEFKSTALWSKSFSKADISASDSKDVHKFGRDTSKVIIAKTIAGFLNTAGGNLVIGIRENKDGQPNSLTGIEGEYAQLKDPCPDGYRRMIVDEIIRKFLPSEIFHHMNNYIRIHFPTLGDKTLCWLEIKKADDGVFIKVQDEEYFFIRIDAETRQISDKALVDYCRKQFH